MVGEHSAIETSLRNQETVLFENDVLFGGPAMIMSGKSKQRSVLDTENVTGSKNKSRRTYQLSSGTDGEPENSNRNAYDIPVLEILFAKFDKYDADQYKDHYNELSQISLVN
ncbi:hypothetical protein QYM36_016297 [Artemia franciscana]|uniref:Uncharacterized protein n=1 Tax=Artemia franciscana TaxID=6661 RepID=A0AA88KTK6_ARTSF|nr:hypothetical protein QYM36_016297 [Artemia franciscana]